MLDRTKATEHHTPHYSIKAVAEATGIRVETLRAWERRYQLVHPERDTSGRRRYSAANVARLRLLRSVTDLGHTISRVAALPDAELTRLLADATKRVRSPARGQFYIDRALEAALNSDPSMVEEVLSSAIALLWPTEVVNAVLVPLAREIGERWHRGAMSIAQEHMVTHIVRRLVLSQTRCFPRDERGPSLVLATLSGESHELGILLCGWIAATRRARTHFLGTELPPAEIARYALEVKAHAVLVSLVLPESEAPAVAQLRILTECLAGRCELWIGGDAARAIPAHELPNNCRYLPTTLELERRLELLKL